MHNILFYTDTPLLGGAENHMLLLAKFLPREKYKVTVACSSYQNLNPWCQQFMALGIGVQRLKVLHKHDPRHFFYIKKLLPKFDLLHLHLWNPASCRYAMLAAGKTPVVITEHDPFRLFGIKAWMKEKLQKKVRAVVVASEAAKKLVLEQDTTLEGVTHVIHNGIDIEAWRQQAHSERNTEARSKYRRTHLHSSLKEKIILCVAELHERKGQKYLISALHKLTDEFPQASAQRERETREESGSASSEPKRALSIKLVFVGDGPSRKYYEKLARSLGEKILFLGRRKDVAQLMSASDMFVLPSVREAFGLVLLEAAIAGAPIIATNVGGIPEIIENEKSGILTPPKDSDALAEAIRRLLLHPDQAEKLSSAAKQRVELLFNANTMAQKTAELYDKLIV